MPSRMLVSLAAAVALTWAIACNRGAPAAPPTTTAPAPTSAPMAPASPAASAAHAQPEPRPTPEEVAAIEHPHVAK